MSCNEIVSSHSNVRFYFPIFQVASRCNELPMVDVTTWNVKKITFLAGLLKTAGRVIFMFKQSLINENNLKCERHFN